MMSMEEKIKMFKSKKAFIEDLNRAFENKQVNSSVESIDYEVYYKEVPVEDGVRDHFVEYVIVNFIGGGKSFKNVSGNSNTANFRVIGPMLDGGYYDEVMDYTVLPKRGYKLVKLSENTFLDKLLARPMTHISDVRACFNYCQDGNDVERVIKMIPSVFGNFEVHFNEDGSTFIVVNSYEENGDYQTEEAEYEFWEES